MPALDIENAGVTVVIPCYNYARFLPEAIESCLAQGHGKLEVLVVDDDSTDNSVAVASAYGHPVRCIRQKNQGVGAARNRGMQEAAHEFVVFLDADDMLAPDALKSFLKTYAEAVEEPGIVAGCASLFDEKGQSMNLDPHPVAWGGVRQVGLEEAVMFTPFNPSVFAKKQFLLELGGFETNDRLYRGSEDKAMWISVAASSRPLLLMGRVILHYRVHGQSMSHNSLRQLGSSQAILRWAHERWGGRLKPEVWNRAWSFSHFQAAIIYSDDQRYHEAMSQLVQSFRLAPWMQHETIVNRYGSFYRLRRLSLILRNWFLSSVGLQSKN